MAIIRAEGETNYLGCVSFGYQKIEITGDKMVQEIQCQDKSFQNLIQESIDKASGYIANYHPKSGTMLQACATLYSFFDDKDISVEGDIGTIPSKDDPYIVY